MKTGNTEEQDAPTPAQRLSALFANMVMQHTNMAFIFLGQVPHPETGKTVRDLDHARYFIDQLEMLEAKTQGNLDKQEQALLKQSLAGLRMAFVEAVSEPAPSAEPAAAPASPEKPSAPAPEVKADDESHKKFSKKY